MKKLITYCSLILILFVSSCASDKDDENKVSNILIESKSSPSIELTSPIYEYIDSRENIHLFGVISNNGETDAVFVQVKCSFYGPDSSLIDEDRSYIIGTNVLITKSAISTNTALRASDSGYFEIWPLLKKSEVASYDCKFTYDIANELTIPSARLVLDGAVNTQKNTIDRLEYLGKVKNTGTKGLTFGQIIFITRDASDSIIDIDFTFINGETVVLSSIDSTTDTALDVNATGTFSNSTLIDYSDYGSHIIRFDWDDAEIVNGVAQKPKFSNRSKPTSNDTKRNSYIERNMVNDEKKFSFSNQ